MLHEKRPVKRKELAAVIVFELILMGSGIMDTMKKSEREAPVILELRDVSFSYDPQELPALQKVNLKIRRGKKVALMGANGSGKSTIVSLYERDTPSGSWGNFIPWGNRWNIQKKDFCGIAKQSRDRISGSGQPAFFGT